MKQRLYVRSALTLLTIALYIIFAAGSDEPVASKASCEVSRVTTDADVGMYNNEPDAGYNVSFTLANNGETGDIRVLVRLSTSEGEWSRTQNLSLDGGTSRRLSYFFQEPTVNAANVQSHVSCRP